MSYKVFDFKCSACPRERYDVLVKDAEVVICDECHTPMERMAVLTRTAHTVGKGRSEESRADYDRKLKERLTKRSADYDASPRGQADREDALHRLRKEGMPV